jgi:hypothetical protein
MTSVQDAIVSHSEREVGPSPAPSESISPFVVGLEVAIAHRARWGFGVAVKSATITRVYKNGNFLLDDNVQWKPSCATWSAGREWTAHAPSHRGYGRVELWTDKLREEIAETARRHQFSTLVDTIRKYCGPVSEATLRSASALASLLAGDAA